MRFAPAAAGNIDGQLGVAIRFMSGDQAHVGLIYQQPGGAFRFLHLPQHGHLQDEPLPKGSYHIAPAWLDSRHQAWLALVCPALQDIVDAYPYSPHYCHGALAADGAFNPPEPGFGLTCATFVMGFLASHGFDVVRAEEWPHRESDDAFHARTIAFLEATHAPEGHIALVANFPVQARFRPAEIAASVAEPGDHPIGYEVAKNLGEVLESAIVGTTK